MTSRFQNQYDQDLKEKTGKTKCPFSNDFYCKCNGCDHSFTQKVCLSQHVKSKHLNERYQCNVCDYKATQNYVLEKHIRRIHQGQQNEKLDCSNCDYQAKTKECLRQHNKLYHSALLHQFICKLCPFKTIYKSSLKEHIKRIHELGNTV